MKNILMFIVLVLWCPLVSVLPVWGFGEVFQLETGGFVQCEDFTVDTDIPTYFLVVDDVNTVRLSQGGGLEPQNTFTFVGKGYWNAATTKINFIGHIPLEDGGFFTLKGTWDMGANSQVLKVKAKAISGFSGCIEWLKLKRSPTSFFPSSPEAPSSSLNVANVAGFWNTVLENAGTAKFKKCSGDVKELEGLTVAGADTTSNCTIPPTQVTQFGNNFTFVSRTIFCDGSRFVVGGGGTVFENSLSGQADTFIDEINTFRTEFFEGEVSGNSITLSLDRAEWNGALNGKCDLSPPLVSSGTISPTATGNVLTQQDSRGIGAPIDMLRQLKRNKGD